MNELQNALCTAAGVPTDSPIRELVETPHGSSAEARPFALWAFRGQMAVLVLICALIVQPEAAQPQDEQPGTLVTPESIEDDIACRLLSWPLSPERATEILKRTQIFTQPAVYDTGEPTPQVAAFNVLLDQPDPLQYLDDLARWGGAVGKLYALCAFQIVDPARGARLAADLRNHQAVVFTQFGCVSDTYTLAELVDTVEKYHYGSWFHEAKMRTYAYFSEPANICRQRTAGGKAVDQ